jgi:predicted aspartyl protease
MSVSAISISLSPVILADANEQSFLIPVSIMGKDKTVENINAQALIDSGAAGIFMDKAFADKHNIKQIPLLKQIRVFNVDGTKNKVSNISHCAWIKTKIGQHKTDTRVLITGLGKEELIFGLPWLKRYNPKIDWQNGHMDMDNFIRKATLSEIIRKQMELSPIRKEVEPIAPEIITKPEKKSYTPTVEEIFEDYPEERPQNLPLGDGQPIL